MYTCDPSGQFYSLQYERIWEVSRGRVGSSISDRMSNRNHFMCSGEATSNHLKETDDKNVPSIKINDEEELEDDFQIQHKEVRYLLNS